MKSSYLIIIFSKDGKESNGRITDGQFLEARLPIFTSSRSNMRHALLGRRCATLPIRLNLTLTATSVLPRNSNRKLYELQNLSAVKPPPSIFSLYDHRAPYFPASVYNYSALSLNKRDSLPALFIKRPRKEGAIDAGGCIGRWGRRTNKLRLTGHFESRKPIVAKTWSTRLDVHNRPVSRFGREMAANRKTAGWGERGYRTMTILRALAWSQPTQGNTCSRLAGYDRCHWLAKLPPGLHTLRLRRSCSPFLSPFLSLFSNVINFRNDVEERERIFRKWIDSLLKTDGFRVRNDLEDNAVTIESRYYGTVMSGEKDRAAPGYSTKSVEIRIYTRLWS